MQNALRTGFEPARGDPKRFLISRLNHSAIAALQTALKFSNIVPTQGGSHYLNQPITKKFKYLITDPSITDPNSNNAN